MANTSKIMQIGLEKKCTELESQLLWKSRSLDCTKEKLRASEENVTLVMAKKEKQSTELMSF